MWIRDAVRLNRAPDGATNCCGVMLDITRGALSEREIRFHSRLLDEVDAAVIATDIKGTVTHWNRYAERLFGYTATRRWDATSPSWAWWTTPASLRARCGCCAPAEPFEGEFRARRKRRQRVRLLHARRADPRRRRRAHRLRRRGVRHHGAQERRARHRRERAALPPARGAGRRQLLRVRLGGPLRGREPGRRHVARLHARGAARHAPARGGCRAEPGGARGHVLGLGPRPAGDDRDRLPAASDGTTFPVEVRVGLLDAGGPSCCSSRSRATSATASAPRSRSPTSSSYDSITGLPNRGLFEEHSSWRWPRAAQGLVGGGAVRGPGPLPSGATRASAGRRATSCCARRRRACARWRARWTCWRGTARTSSCCSCRTWEAKPTRREEIAAEQVFEAFEEPFLIHGAESFIGASIGISVFPSDGGYSGDLIDHAAAALQEVRRGGKAPLGRVRGRVRAPQGAARPGHAAAQGDRPRRVRAPLPAAGEPALGARAGRGRKRPRPARPHRGSGGADPLAGSGARARAARQSSSPWPRSWA